MLKDLVKIANSLDQKGLRAEADYLDQLIRFAAEGSPEEKPKTHQDLLDVAIADLDSLSGTLSALSGTLKNLRSDEYYEQLASDYDNQAYAEALMQQKGRPVPF